MVQIRQRRRGVGVSIKPRHYNRGVGRPAVAVDRVEEEPAEYGPTEYDGENYGPMGLDITSIAPNTTQTVGPIRPNRPIQIEEWRFPSTNIGLLVDEINIGGTPMFARGGVPIELYSEASEIAQGNNPTVTPDTGVTFTVTNPTGAAIDFSGAGWGQVLRRG